MQQLTTSGFVQLYNESENVVVISGAGISAEILDVLFELIVDLQNEKNWTPDAGLDERWCFFFFQN